MKRDFDLIRQILLRIEASSKMGTQIESEFEGYTPDQVQYHYLLLQEANLIETRTGSTLSRTEIIPRRLTWDGHEFLDASRNDTVWRRAQERVSETVSSVPFDALKAILISIATKMVTG